jgi:hypothetical protein
MQCGGLVNAGGAIIGGSSDELEAGAMMRSKCLIHDDCDGHENVMDNVGPGCGSRSA